MRTTVDIPEDLHAQVASIARDRRETFSHTAVHLIRRGLGTDRGARVYVDPVSGRALLDIPRPITSEDVRALEDEE
ncbi:MAG: hypothetical protein LBK59_08320 [Bifidobacteriaceae bacterium]|nr:hypothetical protein [Bifidobacteriaceae bacterium]